MDNELKPDLAKALVAFQAEVPAIEKKRTANIPTKSGGSYSYKYADLADIWDTVRAPLAKHKLAATQMLVGGSDGFTGIQTTVWHESGQCISGVIDVPTQGKTPQEAGSLFTYYKRYALGAALGISTEDDDDGNAASVNPPQKSDREQMFKNAPAASPNKPASEKQRGFLASLAHRKGKDNNWIDSTLERVKTSADASAVIDQLNKLEDA